MGKSDCEGLEVQIKKINNEKLKVILSSHDLNEKNIDIDSFLANTIESQDLFFEILDLAEEQFDFNIENNKAVVEAISLDNNLFILIITKLKNEFTAVATNSLKTFCFHQLDDFFSIYSLLEKDKLSSQNMYLYEWNQKYYLIIDTPSKQIENMLLEYTIPISYPSIGDVLIEHGNRVY